MSFLEMIENFVMPPHPALNGETINRPRGEDTERLIGMQLWSLNQQKLTLLVLCFIHICVYEIAIDCFNYMRSWTIALSQLMCYSESTFVKIIQVVSGVKNLVFRQLVFHHIPLYSGALQLYCLSFDDGAKYQAVPENKAGVFEATLIYWHKLWVVTIRKTLTS